MPFVSVVIPVYNRGAPIQATVDSVLAQDLAPDELEILLVDDGSTDDTFAVLQRLYGDNPRVRLFSIPNGGVAGARNFGLQKARGDFLAFLDHDDRWKPAKLRLQLEMMQKSEKIGVVYCSWTSVDEAGREMPPVIQFQRQWWWKPHSGRAFPWILLPHPLQFIRNPIISMTVPLVRTGLLREIGGFDPAMVPSDDWDLWIRLAHLCDFACVNQELALYVHHSAQQHKQMKTAYASALAIYAKHRVSWAKHPWVRFKQESYRRSCLAMMHHADARDALLGRNRKQILVSTLKALAQRPDSLLLRRWHRVWMRALKEHEN